MAIPSIKQKLFKFLFNKDVTITIQFFNSFSCSIFATAEDQRSLSFHSVHPLPFLPGGLNLQPIFQKEGLDRTSTFRKGVSFSRWGGGFNFQIKKK